MTYTPPDYTGPHYRQALEAAGLRVVSAEYLAALERLAAADDVTERAWDGRGRGQLAYKQLKANFDERDAALQAVRACPEWQQRQEQQP